MITVGAGALSIQKLRKIPNIIDNIVVTVASGIIRRNCFVIENAIEPGAMSKAIANIRPVAFKVATTVKDTDARSNKFRMRTFNPEALACGGSKD